MPFCFYMPTLLELFSGTKSVGKVAEELGYHVISLDQKNANINADILDWDYTGFDVGHFDVIWASPPCTEYSIAKTVGVRNIEHANEIVTKTLEIIDYFQPEYYIIENPQTGYLKKQSFMDGIPYVDVDYCKYGMPYRKRTRIWNNVHGWTPRPLCKKDCDSMNGNKHVKEAQHTHSSNNDYAITPKQHFKQSELYVIPPALIFDIFSSMDN